MREENIAGGLIVGVALEESSAQVSFLRPSQTEPQTLSDIPGAEAYDIPMILARAKYGGRWTFGREAEKAAESGEAELVEGLLKLSVDDGAVTVAGERYAGLLLLVLYIKKLLSLLVMETAGAGAGLEVISALELTMDEPSDDEAAMLTRALKELEKALPRAKKTGWCSYSEGLFNYLKEQPEETRINEVLAFKASGRGLISYRHSINHNTRPFVAVVERRVEGSLPTAVGERDEAFLKTAQERLSDHIVSSVYLLGEGFDEEWLKGSLDYICRGRRAFMGNNLFSRGAVYCLVNRVELKEGGAEVVYLGPDRIMANIGMRVLKQGENHYRALIDAGESWYEARAGLDVILSRDERIALEITPLRDGVRRTEILELDGLGLKNSREKKLARLSIELTMFSPDRVRLSVVDMGFGDFYPSSGEHWERFIALNAAETGAGALEEGIVARPVLCVGRLASRPYEFEFLETRIFSPEELLFFIRKNDYLLTMEHFPDSLPEWLDKECGLSALADRLKELKRRGCSLAAYAGTLFEYIRLYDDDETRRIEETLRDGDARDGAEKKLKIIEYLIREGRLYEAHALIRAYDRTDRHPVVIARLYYDEGVIYARLFHYGAAAVCMGKAWELSGDAQVKEAYLAALRLSMDEEEYIASIGDRPELSPESLTLETKLGETLDLFAAGADNHSINTLSVYLETGNTRQFDISSAEAEEELLAIMRRVTGQGANGA